MTDGIDRLPSGRYRARIMERVNGKVRCRWSGTFDTWKEAKDARDAALGQKQAGTLPTRTNMTVADLAVKFMADC